MLEEIGKVLLFRTLDEIPVMKGKDREQRRNLTGHLQR